MSTVLAQILDPSFIGTILRVATPLLLAALGVMISDRAGVLNIGDTDYQLSSLNPYSEIVRDRTAVIRCRFTF